MAHPVELQQHRIGVVAGNGAAFHDGRNIGHTCYVARLQAPFPAQWERFCIAERVQIIHRLTCFLLFGKHDGFLPKRRKVYFGFAQLVVVVYARLYFVPVAASLHVVQQHFT